MSQENVEIARRAFDAYNRGDIDAAVADIAPDCEFRPTGTVPGVQGAYRGPEGYRRFIAWLSDEFEDVQVSLNDLTDAGDRVLVSLTLQGRGRQSGAPTSWHLWHVWAIQDAKLVRGQAFVDEAEALKAAGLSQ